jgi:hypothetical protein
MRLGRWWALANFALAVAMVWTFVYYLKDLDRYLTTLAADSPLREKWTIYSGVAVFLFLVFNTIRIGMGGPGIFRTILSIPLMAMGFITHILCPMVIIASATMIALILLSPYGVFDWRPSTPVRQGDVLALIGVLIASCVVSWFGDRVGRWLTALLQPSEQLARSRDRRAPVVFLRSFQDEDQLVDWSKADLLTKKDDAMRMEDIIAAELTRLGPFIAVGKPGGFRVTGAARAFYRNDNWQQAVVGWMDDALLIVCVPNLSEGVRWEMLTALERDRANKLILLVPPEDPHRLARCLQIRSCFEGTIWSTAAMAADLSQALAVHCLPDGQLVVIGSQTGTGPEFENALAVAIYGLLLRPSGAIRVAH